MARLLLLALALAVLVALPALLLGDFFAGLFAAEGPAEWLRSTGGWAWAAAIALMASDIALPVPSKPVMAALGVVYGPIVGGVVAAAGDVAAGVIGYGVGRAFGPAVARRLAGADSLAEAERLLERRGGWIVAASRWLPVLPETVSMLAGLARMPFRKFMLALLCGAVPQGFAFAAFGHVGAEAPVLTLMIAALAPLALWPVVARLTRRPVAG